MKIRCIIGSAAFAASLTCSGAWAWDQDPAALYFERKDTIVSGAGDARDVNAATHIIDPWPRYVGNRRIPANGDRMVVAHDDGMSFSINRGKSWHHIQLPIAQMYHVATDNQVPYNVYGNRQDGPSSRGPSNSRLGKQAGANCGRKLGRMRVEQASCVRVIKSFESQLKRLDIIED